MQMADASKWIFRGEGNACLVLVNKEEKRAYRLAKSSHWGKGHLATSSACKIDRIHEELQMVIDYMREVMQPLLSSRFVVLPELCLIAGGLTQEAERQIQSSRPAQRKGKEVYPQTVDPTTLSALVMPDLCYLRDLPARLQSEAPTLSVEIKPKKAFIHDQDIDSLETQNQVCKFCMHQRLKAKEGQWPVTSRYCPLDLFSGDRGRMKQALLALAETPQNNLRICQDGEEILGAWNKGDLHEILERFFGEPPNGYHNGLQKQRTLQIFLDLLLEALLSVTEEADYVVSDGPSLASSHPVQYCQNSRCSPTPSSTCSGCCDLPTGCVLERILTSQRLDELDIDGVYPLFLQLEKTFSEHPELRTKNCLDGPFTHSGWLQACLDSNCATDNLIIENTLHSTAQKVKRFLVSKTIQDCSIMVAFQKIPDSDNEDSGGHLIKDGCGRVFRFSVSIVDLDPKPFCKIHAYHKQNHQIMKAYKEACS